MGPIDIESFRPETLDKVNRLLELLAEMGRHPDLKGKLAMHGGTAINLFMFGLPRLSVDIDMSYVGSLSRAEMMRERPGIERGIQEVASYLGYRVDAREGGHAGRTFVLRYRGNWGNDHVKIDCIYMNRSPLIPLRVRQSPLRPDLDVLMFDDYELAGGKVKAYFDRVKIRDLYDIGNLAEHCSGVEAPDELLHKVLLYYASLSAHFPNSFIGRSLRFEKCEKEVEEQLVPMLRQLEKPPTLDSLMQKAERFVESFVLPKNDLEKEYLERLSQGDYCPELLFGDGGVTQRAAQSPEAQWKLLNLKKMGG